VRPERVVFQPPFFNQHLGLFQGIRDLAIQDKRSLQFRFSTGGMGGGLTAEQPLNNIARETIYAMAAVFSGTRSLNLACFDEVYAIPSDLAIRTSLRVQQILAFETGVADVVDPLGGSYYVEALTDEMEAKIGEIIDTLKKVYGTFKEPTTV
jgi:methylmalonyl-CoA mutase N-terminal domain/subunit